MKMNENIRRKTTVQRPQSTAVLNPFKASCSELLLFEGFSALLV